MPKIDPDACPDGHGTTYPDPYRDTVRNRRWKKIGIGAGLTDYGANLVTLEPGLWSSQRHWHETVDELMIMVEGELTLVEEGARTTMRAGDIAAWAKGVANGHHLINEGDAPARFLVIGANGGGCHYPDLDLFAKGDEPFYRHKDGTPYRVYNRTE